MGVKSTQRSMPYAGPRSAQQSDQKLKHKKAISLEDNRQEAAIQLKLRNSVLAGKSGFAGFSDNRKTAGSVTNSPVQRKENGTVLPEPIKSGIENLSGIGMDDVRVHRNSEKPATLQAHAYAKGSDIHLAAGQEKHLAHEAWHVVQQKQGRVQPTAQLKGSKINDNSVLEKEADQMGAKALLSGVTKSNVPYSLVKAPDSAIQRVTQVLVPRTTRANAQPLPAEEPTPVRREIMNGVSLAGASEDSLESEADEANVSEGVETLGDSLVGEVSGYSKGGEDITLGNAETSISESQAGGGAIVSSIGSGLALIIQISNLSKNWSPDNMAANLGLVVEAAEAAGRTASNIAAGTQHLQEANTEGSGDAAGLASGGGMAFADAIGAVKAGVETIYELYKYYNISKTHIASSNAEKANTAINVLKGLLNTAGKTVSTIKNITDMLQVGSAGLATAVPGIGAAISAVDVAVGFYTMLKAKDNITEMQLTIDGLRAENRRNQRWVPRAAAIPLPAEEPRQTNSAENEELQALENLQKTNRKRLNKAKTNIAFDFISLIGNITACIPEPGSQIAGLSLKIIGGGGKALYSAIGMAKQSARDGGIFSKIAKGNPEKSTAAIQAKNKKTVMYIVSVMKREPTTSLTELEAMPEGDARNTVLAQYRQKEKNLGSLISATGTDPNEFYRTALVDEDPENPSPSAAKTMKALGLLYGNLMK